MADAFHHRFQNYSQEERMAFLAYDDEHHVRATMIEALKKEFSHLDMTYSIGGQLSFDVFPNGQLFLPYLLPGSYTSPILKASLTLI